MIFIAYARVDEDAVEKLERSLGAHGLPTLRDRSILEGGDDWQERLATAIEDADAFLVVWSAASAASEHVHTEVMDAISFGKRIVPCLLDDTPLPPELSRKQGIELGDDLAVSRLGQRLAGRNDWLLKQVFRFLNRMREFEGPGPHRVPLEALLHTPASILAAASRSDEFRGLLDYTEKEIGTALEELVAMERAERIKGEDGTVRYTFFD